MHNLSGLASQLSKKALDAGSALADAQRRVTQQAMEATGMAEKTEEDEPAELQLHTKLESFMRRSYKHTDQYMRALNSVCEMSAALADDFAELIDDPVLRELAAQNSAANHREIMKAMTAGCVCRKQGLLRRPARPGLLIGRGWPKLRAAWGATWR